MSNQMSNQIRNHRLSSGPLTRRSFLGLAAASASAASATLLLSGCSDGSSATDAASDAKLQVVASFYPMYDFATKIGGDRVDVTCLVPAGTEPHDWEPSTTDMRTITDADVLVYNGAGMESWVTDTLDALDTDSLTAVEASNGADLLTLSEDALEAEREEKAEAGEDTTDISDIDPHCWLSPAIAKVEMANIRDGLTQADPDGADTYSANYDTWAAELDQLDQEYQDGLDPLPNKTIVVSHEAFGYICRDYGLTQLAIEGLDADAEPDAQTMAEIVDFVNENGVKVIFSEELVSSKVAQSIADATGATVEELNPIEGLTQDELDAGEDYFSTMRENLEKLEGALA